MTQQLSKQERASRRGESEMRKDIRNITLMQQPALTRQQIAHQIVEQGSAGKIVTESMSISSDRNMKFKLDQLQQRLRELLQNVRSARDEFRQLLELSSLMKKGLIYEDLYGIKGELQAKMQGLSSQIRNGKVNDDNRYGQIRKGCGVLWEQTEQIREQAFQIELRVQELQERLGFHQKYKYSLS